MSACLPILMFHVLDDGPAPVSFCPDAFRRGMTRLHDLGYQAVSLLDVANGRQGVWPFPERCLVITFDDGDWTVFDRAFPVLQDLGMTATVFLTVGAPGTAQSGERLPAHKGRTMMTWSQVREMRRAGISFGAHTCTHPDLTRLPTERAEAEMRDSKLILEDALGEPVESFAYPFGRYNGRIRTIAQQHFACACSDRLGLVTARSDPYALERLDAYYFRRHWAFDLLSSRLLAPYVWVRSIPRRLRRAVVRHPASGRQPGRG